MPSAASRRCGRRDSSSCRAGCPWRRPSSPCRPSASPRADPGSGRRLLPRWATARRRALPAGTSAVANSPLAMLVKTDLAVDLDVGRRDGRRVGHQDAGLAGPDRLGRGRVGGAPRRRRPPRRAGAGRRPGGRRPRPSTVVATVTSSAPEKSISCLPERAGRARARRRRRRRPRRSCRRCSPRPWRLAPPARPRPCRPLPPDGAGARLGRRRPPAAQQPRMGWSARPLPPSTEAFMTTPRLSKFPVARTPCAVARVVIPRPQAD